MSLGGGYLRIRRAPNSLMAVSSAGSPLMSTCSVPLIHPTTSEAVWRRRSGVRESSFTSVRPLLNGGAFNPSSTALKVLAEVIAHPLLSPPELGGGKEMSVRRLHGNA